MSQIFTKKPEWKKLIRNIADVIPIGPDHKFNPNIKPVELGILKSPEFEKFRTNDPSQFLTYGMTAQELADATMHHDPRHGFLDKAHSPAEVENRVYNVTSNGSLVIQPKEITSQFNHSSFTKDGAVICAGYVTIHQGEITELNNFSGHYKPTALDLYNAVIELRKKDGKIFASNCIIKLSGDIQFDNNVDSFIHFMEQEVTVGNKQMSRANSLREARKMEAEQMTAKHAFRHVFNGPENNLGDMIANQSGAFAFQEMKQNLCTLPAKLFSAEFQDAYKAKVGAKYAIQNITLNSTELLEYLAHNEMPNREAAIHTLMANGAYKDGNLLRSLQDESNAFLKAEVKKTLIALPMDDNSAQLLYNLDRSDPQVMAKLLAPQNLQHSVKAFDMWGIIQMHSRADRKLKADLKDAILQDLSNYNNLNAIIHIATNSPDAESLASELLSGANLQHVVALRPPHDVRALYDKSTNEVKTSVQTELFKDLSNKQNLDALVQLSQSSPEIASKLLSRENLDHVILAALPQNLMSEMYMRATPDIKTFVKQELSKDLSNKRHLQILAQIAISDPAERTLASELLNGTNSHHTITGLLPFEIATLYHNATDEIKTHVRTKLLKDFGNNSRILYEIATRDIQSDEVASAILQPSNFDIHMKSFGSYAISSLYEKLTHDATKQSCIQGLKNNIEHPEYARALAEIGQAHPDVALSLNDHELSRIIDSVDSYTTLRMCASTTDMQQRLINSMTNYTNKAFLMGRDILTDNQYRPQMTDFAIKAMDVMTTWPETELRKNAMDILAQAQGRFERSYFISSTFGNETNDIKKMAYIDKLAQLVVKSGITPQQIQTFDEQFKQSYIKQVAINAGRDIQDNPHASPSATATPHPHTHNSALHK